MNWRQRIFPNGEWVLLVALVVEIALFSAISRNFATVGNFFEVLRLSVELGLLAVALTPVIISGGIDLSVGSMVGLAAVVFGAAVQDWHLPVAVAALIALLVGAAGGALNGLLIARFDIPPLIVTLGTFSLFRGIAEGLTHAAVNYTGFPAGFLALGQGYLGGIIPAQLPLFLLVLAGFAVLLHRSVIGRAIYAIGFGAAGARYAGLPVQRRLGLVYVLSGLAASLAAIVYVAHLGQARSDAGTGYELDAIAAVVLGGTSVFGGRGTLWGTLLGLLSLSVLRNGVQLAALPSELTGVLTGVLLVTTIAIDRWRGLDAAAPPPSSEDLDVKNSQVAMLCGAIIAAGIVVAGTNAWLVQSLQSGAPVATAVQSSAGASTPAPGGKRLVIAMMPKAKGDPYFVSCRIGAEEAAKELGVELIWDGPTGLDAAKQNEVIENWITRKVDAIAVAVENRGGISTVLRKARERGIHVLTWDADAEPDARNFFVNQATAEGIGNTLTDEAARLLKGKGEFAILTGALSAANQNEWIAVHQEACGRKTSRADVGDDSANRRRPRQGVCRDADRDARPSQRQARDGDLGPGRARCGRGGPPGGAQGRQRHRTLAAESQQALRAQRRRPDRRALEHRRPRLSFGVRQHARRAGQAAGRHGFVPGRPPRHDRDPRQRDHPRAAAHVHEGEYR